jgi:hypothetical protein
MRIMTEHWGFVDGLLARVEGPFSFRLIVQPLVALFFGIRDGVKDARERKPPYFWALFTDADHRHDMLGSGWKSIGKVFIIAIVLDLIFQYLALGDFRPIGALLAGIILAVIPYLLFRGPVNRFMRLKHKEKDS